MDEKQIKELKDYIEKLEKKERAFSKSVRRYADTFEWIKTKEEKLRLLNALQDAEDWGKSIQKKEQP